MFNFLRPKKKVIVVYYNVMSVASQDVKKLCEQIENMFIQKLGKNYSVIVMPVNTETRIECLI